MEKNKYDTFLSGLGCMVIGMIIGVIITTIDNKNNNKNIGKFKSGDFVRMKIDGRKCQMIGNGSVRCPFSDDYHYVEVREFEIESYNGN
jgi:hypothetical protein